MRLHAVTVVPSLPEPLKPLEKLARNLWYTWHPEAVELWRRLDRDLWEDVYHNPVRMLGRISQEKLEELLVNESFLLQMDRLQEALDQYLEAKTPYSFHLDKNLAPSFRVVYFSMEYGLTEALPMYSGGLGILSGDHLKSASNLNLPIVGVGLLYREGYFGQYLNKEGWQQEYYVGNDYENMPIFQQKDARGLPLEVVQEIGGRPVRANIWRVQVGRVPLYLLNTNLPGNPKEDREITAQLYGGDREMRIRQEILLGMGGERLLHALGYQPTVYHMNEGHSAFVGLARIRRLVEEDGLTVAEAREVVKSNTVFTTHTPVPAGNDYFTPELMERYFRGFAEKLKISFHDFLGFGRQNPSNPQEAYCMTVLAIRLSNHRNGVSRLHQEVSRDMWRGLWNGFPLRELPIGSVTNGVHIPSYISSEMADLFDRYMGPRWIEDPDNQKVWERVERIPDTELWRTHERRRERLIAFARNRLREQLIRRGALPSELRDAENVLSAEALTICFARRFATYKRGDILFRDPDRLERILNDPQRPVQIVFAGKAHPQDMEGKAIIKNIIHFAQQERFRDRVIFLENYDINLARYLVQGADVWLNTPRRPLEACGTSGMKAVANGALHLSILDGWWDEGYRAGLGWAIGAGEQYLDTQYQDEIEGRNIYELLEREVIPLFYDRARDGLPRGWIEMMKRSMQELCPRFNSHRMIEDYVDEYYVPASRTYGMITRDDYQEARAYAAWKRKVWEKWPSVSVVRVDAPDQRDKVPVHSAYHVQSRVQLGGLAPGDVRVEICYGPMDVQGELKASRAETMACHEELGKGEYLYQGEISFRQTGQLGFAVRVMPDHALLVHPMDMGLVAWG